MRGARSRIVRVDESPLEACLRDRGYGDVADEIGARHAYTGRSGATGGLTPRDDLVNAGTGILTQPYDDVAANRTGTAFTPASGTIYGCAVGLRKGEIVNKLVLGVAGAPAAIGTVTLAKVALADKTGKVLAVTADLSATLLTSTTGGNPYSVVTPYTVTADDFYYCFFLRVGVYATVDIILFRTFGADGDNNAYVVGGKSRAPQLAGQADLVVGTTYAVARAPGAPSTWIAPAT